MEWCGAISFLDEDIRIPVRIALEVIRNKEGKEGLLMISHVDYAWLNVESPHYIHIIESSLFLSALQWRRHRSTKYCTISIVPAASRPTTLLGGSLFF